MSGTEGFIRSLFQFVTLAAVSLVVLLLLGIPLATWMYVIGMGARADAVVIAKTESVYHQYGGNWKLYHRLKVRYSPRDTARMEEATIDADEDTWDQSSPGSRVQIAYVPVAGLRQIPWYYTKELAERLPPFWRGPDGERTAAAQVVNTQHIRVVGESSEEEGVPAWQPFDVVELRFVPEGRHDAVTAVDAVDSGSVPGLTEKRTVAIHYSLRRPREVKIDGATRDHVWKNNVEVFGPLGLLVALLVALLLRRKMGVANR